LLATVVFNRLLVLIRSDRRGGVGVELRCRRRFSDRGSRHGHRLFEHRVGAAGRLRCDCDRGVRLGSRAVQVIEHLRKQGGRLRLAARRRDFAPFVFVLSVADSATRLSDFIVDHRDYRVVGDAALAWTVIIQHVAGPIPAVLHATLPKNRCQPPAKPYRYWSIYCFEP
jgi:hypothetical protein